MPFEAIGVANMFTKLESNGYQDVCTITRRTAGPTWDYTLNTQTDPTLTILYSGPCRVRSTPSSSDEDIVGLEHAYTRRIGIVIPFSETLDFHVGDVMRIDQSVLDPYMAGIDYFVTDVQRVTWKVDIHLTGLETQASDGAV